MEGEESERKSQRDPNSVRTSEAVPWTPRLEQKHLHAIDLLIAHKHDKSHAEIAQEVGVAHSTLSKWKKWPPFMAAYENRLQEWRRDLTEIRFVDKKERILELVRLYTTLPDEAGERDGVTIYNHNQKAKLLDQIADEVGDKKTRHEISGPGGAPIQINVHQLGIEELEKLDSILDRNEKLFQAQLQEKLREGEDPV